MTLDHIQNTYPLAYKKLYDFGSMISSKVFSALQNIPFDANSPRPDNLNEDNISKGTVNVLWQRADRCLIDFFDLHGKHITITGKPGAFRWFLPDYEETDTVYNTRPEAEQAAYEYTLPLINN